MSDPDSLAGAQPAERQLSIPELQRALRSLRAQPGLLHRGEEGCLQRTGGSVGQLNPDGSPVGGWVAVIAAHPGAGASTVALALAEAIAQRHGSRAHLVETAPPASSGLAASVRRELGTDESGCWRRGTRGDVTVDRRAATDAAAPWPSALLTRPGLCVLDLGVAADGEVDALVLGARHVVMVCHATVPGLRRAQAALARLEDLPSVLVSVGARGWSGAVNAAAGTQMRDMRASGHVVDVPPDRRLRLAGATGEPLPRPVMSAARRLLQLVSAPNATGPE